MLTRPMSYHDFYDEFGRSKVNFEGHGSVDGFKPSGSLDLSYLLASYNSMNLLSKINPDYCATKLHKHCPYVLSKSVLEGIETKYLEEIDTTRQQKVRSNQDINLLSYFYHHYACVHNLAVSCSYPSKIIHGRNFKKSLNMNSMGMFTSICFNDGEGSTKIRKFRSIYRREVQKFYPTRSPYEVV